MKRVISLLAFLILLTTSFSVFAMELVSVGGSKPDVPSFVGYAPNRIVVRFDPPALLGFDKAAMARGITGTPALDHLGARHGVVSLLPQFPGARKAIFKGKEVDLTGWYKVNFSRAVDVLSIVAEYKAIPGVVDAQPVGIHRVSVTQPNDPWYSPQHDPNYQWHLPKIQAPEAWDIEKGNPAIIVAVLDTGVRYFHKDLGGSNASLSNPTAVEGNMWINMPEKNGTPGQDDDPMSNPLGRQYVDDWIGWDFVHDPCGPPGAFLCYPCCCFEGEDCMDPDNDPRDFHGHGTHCAGNVSAINNNLFATASPAGGWGSWYTPPFGNGVKVMALRIGWNAVYVLFEVGLVAMDYAAEALYYAADHGAKIASCSWGSDDSGGIGAAIDYFVGKGGLIFKAAGNEGTETAADYMCARDDVLCVAATDQNDCKASFSTYGTWVDVSAPGVQVGSLWHSYTDPVNDYVNKLDGTSMATPLAASVAALIWSRETSLSANDVKNILLASADPIDDLLCNSSFSGKLGAGRINAYQGVLSVAYSPPVAGFSGTPTSGNAPLTVAFTDQSTGTISSRSWEFGDGGTSTAQNPSHTYTTEGTYNVSLTVTGPGGETDTNTKPGYITVSADTSWTAGVVEPLVTGKYATYGQGKNKYTEFTSTNSFYQGDVVIIQATVKDSHGGNVTGATVEFNISGPGPVGPVATTITSDPSGINGVAEARWKTSAPRNKNSSGGTPTGEYTAIVTNVSATGYPWDRVSRNTAFAILQK
jgi:PKD repeat protein